MKDLEIIYNSRIEETGLKLKKFKQKSKLSSYLRALIFLIIFAILYFYKSIDTALIASLIIVLFSLFIYLVKKNISLKKQIKKATELIKINEHELIALQGSYHIFHDGKEYHDPEHPYSYDMDIFGKGSLYQYLNRTCTISGKNQLAFDLTNINLSKDRIIEKQISIKELSKKLIWRQEFISTALSNDEKFRENLSEKENKVYQKLNFWSGDEVKFIRKKIWKYILTIIPSLTIVLFFATVFKLIAFPFIVSVGLLNLAVMGLYIKKINDEHSKLGKITKSLRTFESLTWLIENESFNSSYLLKIKSKLTSGISSHSSIKKLHKTLQSFDTRLNFIAGILLNAILLWDLQVIFRLEKQKKQIKDHLPSWFDALGKFDALISLANYTYNNTNHVFPEISENDFYLEMIEGGHPLIHKDQRVNNSFQIDGLQKINIITGANMAGKSTFLRTIGINMILGTTGSPVCAEKFVFTPIHIFTSVRTNDSLHKNESYFYAELMRLKRITDHLKSGAKLFIILDEMLKGTNSKDKHTGSYALIEQLIKLEASGLAATHDIQLGSLKDKYPENIANKRFEVEIKEEELIFDYKLKDGISQSLNASFLMKKYGIIE